MTLAVLPGRARGLLHDLYTLACLFNVVLDAVLTYFKARQITMSLGFRTVEGLKLEEIKTFQESFETYAMQRMLGENVYAYLVSCIFLPFVLEPLITILFPLLAAEWIVGSHPEMTGPEAQEWFRAPRMELGRYADIMLNMLLALLIFYFPGGWTHWCFFGMAAAHCWIYILDHVRVNWNKAVLGETRFLVLTCTRFSLVLSPLLF